MDSIRWSYKTTPPQNNLSVLEEHKLDIEYLINAHLSTQCKSSNTLLYNYMH